MDAIDNLAGFADTGLVRLVKSAGGSHVTHKYISKRPDGKGSWIYTYRRPDGTTYTSNEKPKRDLYQWKKTVHGARARLKAQMAAHPEGGTKEHHAKLADLAKQEAYVKRMSAAGHTHAEEDGHLTEESAAPPATPPEPPKAPAYRPVPGKRTKMPDGSIGTVRGYGSDASGEYVTVQRDGSYGAHIRLPVSSIRRLTDEDRQQDSDVLDPIPEPSKAKEPKTKAKEPEKPVESGDPEVEKLYREGYSREEAAKRIERKRAEEREAKAKKLTEGVPKPFEHIAQQMEKNIGSMFNEQGKFTPGSAYWINDGLKLAALDIGASPDDMRTFAKQLRERHPEFVQIGDMLDRWAKSTEDKKAKAKAEADAKREADEKFRATATLEQLAERDHDAFGARAAKVYDEAKASKDPSKMIAAAMELEAGARGAAKQHATWSRSSYSSHAQQQIAKHAARGRNLRTQAEELRKDAQKRERAAATRARSKAISDAMAGDHKPGTVKDGKVHLSMADGPKLTDTAAVHGDYAVHTHHSGKGYSVTHIPTGMSANATGAALSKTDAVLYARKLNEHAPGIMGKEFGKPNPGPEDAAKFRAATAAFHEAKAAKKEDKVSYHQPRAMKKSAGRGTENRMRSIDHANEADRLYTENPDPETEKSMDPIDRLNALVKGGGTGEARGGKYTKREFVGGRWRYEYPDHIHNAKQGREWHKEQARAAYDAHRDAHQRYADLGSKAQAEHGRWPRGEGKSEYWDGTVQTHWPEETKEKLRAARAEAGKHHEEYSAHVAMSRKRNLPMDEPGAMAYHRESDRREKASAESTPSIRKAEKSTMSTTPMIKSTPQLRSAFRGLDGPEPLAKGLYKFTASPSDAKLPDEYLIAYLDAFIEEATEHEMGEKAHSTDAMTMGPAPGDVVDLIARFVFNELLAYLPSNSNLMRACKLANATCDYIAERIRDMGLVKPLASHRTDHGDFLQGYMYSEQQEQGYVGKSYGPGTVLDEGAMLKAVADARRISSAIDGPQVHVPADDPHALLGDFHRAQRARIAAFYGEGPVRHQRGAGEPQR